MYTNVKHCFHSCHQCDNLDGLNKYKQQITNNLQLYSCARSQHAHAIRVNWLNIITNWNEKNFLNVLKDRSDFVKYTNKGFISKNKRVYTYSLTKKGLGYLYCRRKVLENGVSTTYLDI